MNNESSKDNFGTKLGRMVVSFLVFLSVFFIIKLLIIIALRFFVTPDNVMTIQSIGTIFLLLSIGIAAVYTKILNRSGTEEGRNKKRIITMALGIVCLLVSTVILQIPIF